MGHWNYRILAKKLPLDLGVYFEVHEVYYDNNGVPNGYAESPATIYSESLDGLDWVFDHIREAGMKPILCAYDFPKEYNRNELRTV